MRGESLRRGAEGSYETGVQCLYLSHRVSHTLPPSWQPALGVAMPGAAAEGRDRPVLAALALLLLPSLRAMNQL